MKNILAAIMALTLSCSAFAGDKLDKATEGLSCYQALNGTETETRWEGIYLDSTPRKLFGQVEQTYLVYEDNALVGVIFDLGIEAPKYKQAHRLYKYLVRKYDHPIDTGSSWMWVTDTGFILVMTHGTQPRSIAFAIACN